MTPVLVFFWPHFDKETEAQKAEKKESRDHDVAAIRAAAWSSNAAVALEEAKNLAEQESERKKGAENKASIFLAVIAAVVPVLASLSTDFFGDGFASRSLAFRAVTLVLLGLGMLYLLNSGIWAFRTFKVSTLYRVDTPDYVKIWSAPSPEENLASEIFAATRLNRDTVNWKVSCIRQAHEFLIRAFVWFSILMLTIVGWEPARQLGIVVAAWTSGVFQTDVAGDIGKIR